MRKSRSFLRTFVIQFIYWGLVIGAILVLIALTVASFGAARLAEAFFSTKVLLTVLGICVVLAAIQALLQTRR